MPAVRTERASTRTSPGPTAPGKLKPSLENAKRVLARIAHLPPLLLPRTNLPPLPPTSAPSKPPLPPANTPLKPSPDLSPPASSKRKRSPSSDSKPDIDDPDPPPAKRPKPDPATARLLTSSPLVGQGTPPVARAKREETPAVSAKPTPPSVHATPGGGSGSGSGSGASDVKELEAKIKLLIDQIHKTRKFSEMLYKDSDCLRALSPSSPSYDPHTTPLLALMQYTDATIYYLTSVWFEDELLATENEYERRTAHRWSGAGGGDKAGGRARREGTSGWSGACTRLRRVRDDWQALADSAEWAAGATGMLDLLLSAAYARMADAHQRVAYRNTARWLNAHHTRWEKNAEYNAALDKHGMDEHGTYRCVPQSVIAARWCAEQCAEALARARSTLLVPGYIARVFPRVWRDCTRPPPSASSPPPSTPLEEGEQPPSPPHKPPFDPYSPDPLTPYSVPLEPSRGTPGGEMFFQWPMDVGHTAVSCFAAFGRGVVYDVGRAAGVGRATASTPGGDAEVWVPDHGLNAAFGRNRDVRTSTSREGSLREEAGGISAQASREREREVKEESRS